jgi:hypothetical protein
MIEVRDWTRAKRLQVTLLARRVLAELVSIELAVVEFVTTVASPGDRP